MLQEAMTKKLPSRPPHFFRPAPLPARPKPPDGVRFKPGQVANPRGRPPGSKNKQDVLKNQIISSTGMTPLEFLTFAYRNQLYAEYIEELASDGKTVLFKPKPSAAKIEVPLQLRASCAQSAAPYVHKKMPIGVEVKERNAAYLSTEKLRSMSSKQLENFLAFMDQFGMHVDLASTRELAGPEEEA